MKNRIGIVSALVIAIMMVVTSCSKDKDPAESDFFVGTYKGAISYTQGEDVTSDTDGRVTVVKVSNSYTFDFGSGIPNITGVKFEKSDDGSYVSIGDGLTGITIDANSLKVLVVNDEGSWTADCTR